MNDDLRDRVESWLTILDDSNYYELLGILEAANEEAIQQAFHEFSQHFHPDSHRRAPADVREAVTKIFKRGAEAYGVLRDPKTRAAYDLALAQGALRYSRTGGSSVRRGEARGLDSHCTTPGGKLHARQAERALSEGKLKEAEQLLFKAQTAEGVNIGLEDRFRELYEVAAGMPWVGSKQPPF